MLPWAWVLPSALAWVLPSGRAGGRAEFHGIRLEAEVQPYRVPLAGVHVGQLVGRYAGVVDESTDGVVPVRGGAVGRFFQPAQLEVVKEGVYQRLELRAIHGPRNQPGVGDAELALLRRVRLLRGRGRWRRWCGCWCRRRLGSVRACRRGVAPPAPAVVVTGAHADDVGLAVVGAADGDVGFCVG